MTYLPVGQLQPYYRNAHIGNVPRIRRSLQTHRQFKAIVVNRGTYTGRPWEVLCGSHTLYAAQQEGLGELGCHVVDVDDRQATEINLVDNPRRAHPEDLDYDDTTLFELLSGLPELDGAGYDLGDIAALEDSLREPDPPHKPGKTDPDATPDVPLVVVTRPGDVWVLGPHRLMCGDATRADQLAGLVGSDVPAVVYSDPPYGLSVVGGDGKVGDAVGTPFRGTKGNGKIIPTTAYRPVTGDVTTRTAVVSSAALLGAYPGAKHIWWGANHYARSAGLPDSRCWLVWDKENGTNDFADAELAWTNHPGSVRLLRHMWNGMLRASERGRRVHPTQKPVALAVWAFGAVKAPDAGVVLDVFAGSGSTLIAAHQTGRTAVLMELEPAYCDVICRRFQEHTGVLPARAGVEHDFTTTVT